VTSTRANPQPTGILLLVDLIGEASEWFQGRTQEITNNVVEGCCMALLGAAGVSMGIQSAMVMGEAAAAGKPG